MGYRVRPNPILVPDLSKGTMMAATKCPWMLTSNMMEEPNPHILQKKGECIIDSASLFLFKMTGYHNHIMFYTYKELVIVVSHPTAVPEVIADVFTPLQ